MAYCCENIQKAKELIVRAGRTLDWSSGWSGGEAFLAGLTLGISSNIKQGDDRKEANKRMCEAYNDLSQAEKLINSCNCGEEREHWKKEELKERNRANDNAKDYNKVIKDLKELNDKYNELVEKFNKNVGDFNRLAGENSGLLERFEDLQRNHNRLERDIRELRENSENEKNTLQRELLQLTANEARLRGEGIGLRRINTETRERNVILSTRIEEKDRLIERKNDDLSLLTNQMADLRIESERVTNQLQSTSQELIRIRTELDERITSEDLLNLLNELAEKEQKITDLQEELSQSQGVGIVEKLRNKEQRLESFSQNCGADWIIIRNLRDAYQNLIEARENYNRNEIREAENSIEVLREAIKEKVNNLSGAHEIFAKCEEVAELRVEREKWNQQQFEAHIEIPPHGDNNQF